MTGPARRGRPRSFTQVTLVVLVISLTTPGLLPRATAQGPLGDPTGRSGEPPKLPPPEEPRPLPQPVPILPPLPPPSRPELEPLPRERVFVRAVRVVGSTVFSDEELAQVTAPYVNRELTAEDLEALRLALTRLYVDRQYVNSGAILPDQTVSDGVVTYQIIEGQLSGIEVDGNRWFRAGYFRRRLALSAGAPVNVDRLQQQLQILLEDPRIARLNAELKPGLRLGEGVLDVHVEDRQPFKMSLDVNNYQSPSVGAERGILTLEDQNLTGNGDILTLRYGKSSGVDPLLDFRYALPLTARDTTVSLQYRRNTFNVIDPQFQALHIDSDSQIYTIGLRQPVYRTLRDEVALELIGERESLRTTLLGRPFSLEPGAHGGESVVTALRFAQEWTHRTPEQVIAARSRFSLGIDALGATLSNHSNNIPDGRFFAWLGQFQWVRRTPLLDTYLIFRTDLQIAANPLLILEQLAVGGRYSVRGYRENTVVRDNAFLTSLEARIPVLRNRRWASVVELAPFVDYGQAWSTGGPTPGPHDLPSVGIGLRWAAAVASPVAVRPQFEVYWGHALRDITTSGGNLQDYGIHFQFVLGLF